MTLPAFPPGAALTGRLVSMLRDEGRHDLADRLSRPRLGHIPQGRVRALIH